MDLKSEIKRYALEVAGFDLVGFSSVELDEKHQDALEYWVRVGFAGEMNYMKDRPSLRANLRERYPQAKSVISLALNYYHPEDSQPAEMSGKVAKYAYGRDYHKIISKKLKKIIAHIQTLSPGASKAIAYVDTGPVLEKAYAQKSGIGFFGKNTNIISRHYGSWILLACVITELELEPDEPHTGACGSCRICIDACPTQALLGSYQLDASKCISYQTIENRQEHIDASLAKKISPWIFGCDVCQDVCPYNFRAKLTKCEELYPNKISGSFVKFSDIEAMTEDDQYKDRFAGSPLMRAKRKGLQRNAQAIKNNVSNRGT